MAHDLKKFETFRGRHKGRRCFIIGSGPSLLKMDLTKMTGEILFGANQVYRYYKNGLPHLSYWNIGDQTCPPKIEADKKNGFWAEAEMLGIRFNRSSGFKICVPIYRRAIPYEVEDAQPVMEFKCDPTKPITHGNSITAESIAFAIFMGCEPIYIIGVDMSYKKGTPGYMDFSYPMAHQAHEKIRQYCDARGIRIFNAGIEGLLKAYERIEYAKLF